jgi:acetoin utilization deacetylase AcuC-like enzyme
MVQNLQSKCHDSRQRRIHEGKDTLGFIGYIDNDTFVTTETFDVCRRATTAWMRGVDTFLQQQQQQMPAASSTHTIPMAMALTRPPGHHATRSTSNGFCIFNYAAASAEWYLRKSQATSSDSFKVSILDWDVHYGHGVANIVQDHPLIIRNLNNAVMGFWTVQRGLIRQFFYS